MVLRISGLGTEHNFEEVHAWKPISDVAKIAFFVLFWLVASRISASDIYLSLCLIIKYYFDVHISKGYPLTIIKMVLNYADFEVHAAAKEDQSPSTGMSRKLLPKDLLVTTIIQYPLSGGQNRDCASGAGASCVAYIYSCCDPCHCIVTACCCPPTLESNASGSA